MKNYNFTNRKLNYLIIGGLNTGFGYISSILIYYTFCFFIHIIILGVIGTIINITFSFCTYKLLVFCTKGNWIKEYLRCYVVYGLSSIISILIMWILVDGLKFQFWFAQGLVLSVLVIISYIGHSRFTFAIKSSKSTN
jgi:putative flippase GtrA